jgi:hypothetical protein
MTKPGTGTGTPASAPLAGPASCTSCEHACWRGNRVVQCLALGTESSRTAQLLQTLLFSLAHERPCPAHAPWEPGPNAYFSQDLPHADHEHDPSHTD